MGDKEGAAKDAKEAADKVTEDTSSNRKGGPQSSDSVSTGDDGAKDSVSTGKQGGGGGG